MLHVFGKPVDGHGRFNRREVLRAGALSMGSLTLADLFRQTAFANGRAKAKHCILMLLNGGQAQLDTFDMKPMAPENIRGPYQPISTAVPGIQICEKLPLLSRLTDRMAIIRSMHHHLLAQIKTSPRNRPTIPPMEQVLPSCCRLQNRCPALC